MSIFNARITKTKETLEAGGYFANIPNGFVQTRKNGKKQPMYRTRLLTHEGVAVPGISRRTFQALQKRRLLKVETVDDRGKEVPYGERKWFLADDVTFEDWKKV